jgi:hypothetical protein
MILDGEVTGDRRIRKDLEGTYQLLSTSLEHNRCTNLLGKNYDKDVLVIRGYKMKACDGGNAPHIRNFDIASVIPHRISPGSTWIR